MFSYFTNTGIQFFSNSDWGLGRDSLSNIALTDDENSKVIGPYIYHLLKNEWIPLSLDGRRNILRVYFRDSYNKESGNSLEPVFALDTTLHDPKTCPNTLTEKDIGHDIETISVFISHSINNPEEISNNPDMIKEIYDSHISETRSWLQDIHNRKKQAISEQKTVKDGLDRNGFSIEDMDPILASSVLLYLFLCWKGILRGGENRIKILTDTAGGTTNIETTLVLDFGNSRTIGLLVEGKNTPVDMKSAIPLALLDHYKIEQEGANYLKESISDDFTEFNYLINSILRFRKGIFSRYNSTKNFHFPSIVVMGTEAESMGESKLKQGRSGISGPKRYLWDNRKRETYWYFHEQEDGESKTIAGDILLHCDPEDQDIFYDNNESRALSPPPQPIYPKRVMMVHAMVEILYQAFCQVNSHYYREKAGNNDRKRTLTKVILSFPTGMPFWERKRFKKQCNKAQNILSEVRMNILPHPIEIQLGSDEASCSQIAFLYGQTKRFKGNVQKFFNMVSTSDDKNRVRIATLDIGGGTSDLMISDFTVANPKIPENPDIKQKSVFSDGVCFAGDDIIEDFIITRIIPFLRGIKMSYSDDRFLKYFGPNAPKRSTSERVEAMNGFFIPIAEMYMHIIANGAKIEKQIKKLTTIKLIQDYQKENNLKLIKEFEDMPYIENVIDSDTWVTPSFSGLFPSVAELETDVIKVLGNELNRYANIINRYQPDFLLFAGRTTTLSVIPRFFSDALTLSPDRIIPLAGYYIGNWYPFSHYNGVVSDPKTAVVVGNLIGYLSNQRRMEDVNIITDGDKSDFTLNYIGYVPYGKKNLKPENIIYDNFQSSNSGVVKLNNKAYILSKNISDENKFCSLMYSLGIQEGSIVADGVPLQVTIDTSTPQERLKVRSVQGMVIDDNGNGERRDATKDDVILQEQTLFNEEYFLDNAQFDIRPLSRK